MKKGLFLINLIFINSIYCWDVRFHNKTPHPINFIVKNNQAGCKNGSLLVKPNTTGTFNFKNLSLPCTRATCISGITANIDITGKLTENIGKDITKLKDTKVVTLQFNIGDTQFSGGEVMAAGYRSSVEVSNPMSVTSSPEAGAFILVASIVYAAGDSLVQGFKKAEAQCRDMTITIEGKGNSATDYKVMWQRGLKDY